MKTLDRCYEIQYNKFFWIDLIPNLETYDRVFWIDSGLSHGGIFHEKYSYGVGYERHFNFTLFNNELLNKLIKLTEDKTLIISKNNSGIFYWSQTIPQKYYQTYLNDEHIVGGLFGGTVENLKKFKLEFEILLIDLLKNEKELYYEELIMSCLYKNNPKEFLTLNFDDWYDRNDPIKYGNNVKYFYNAFEITKTCVCAASIEIDLNSNNYLNKAKELIESNLKYHNYDILLLTNNKDFFSKIRNSRLKIVDYDTNFNESITSAGRFNMHIKRFPIKLSQSLGYDIIYYNDCDCFITGWDHNNFTKKCEEDFDVAFVSHANPQLGGLRTTYKHFQDKIDLEFGDLYYDELDMAPNPAETRVIFKNNNKLSLFLEFWDKISLKNKDYFTYHDGVYFGTSAIYAKMKMTGITSFDEFSKYCRISHAGNILDYFGHQVNLNSEDIETIEVIVEDDPVRGSFVYKGLSMLQNKNVANVFKQLLLEKQPKRIIEIGTEYGGLTLLLQDLIIELGLENTIIRSYDIKIPKFLVEHPEITDIIQIVTKNIFNSNPFELKTESIDELKSFMQEPGTNIILCDGGNKIGEFNTISNIIGEGDIIMAHDYAKNDLIFKEKLLNKIWNWKEIEESDIIESINRNNLTPYMDEEFTNVAWVCKIKS